MQSVPGVCVGANLLERIFTSTSHVLFRSLAGRQTGAGLDLYLTDMDTVTQ